MKTGGFRRRLSRLAPFPFTSMFQNGPRRQGVRSAESFQTRKRFSSAAHKPRALAGSGPFRRLTYEKGKGANAKAKPFRGCGRVSPPDGRPRGD
jgi:hypothetical protein